MLWNEIAGTLLHVTKGQNMAANIWIMPWYSKCKTFFSQTGHATIGLVLCVNRCFFMLVSVISLLHTGQFCRFSPLWIFMCLCKPPFVANVASHFGHFTDRALSFVSTIFKTISEKERSWLLTCYYPVKMALSLTSISARRSRVYKLYTSRYTSNKLRSTTNSRHTLLQFQFLTQHTSSPSKCRRTVYISFTNVKKVKLCAYPFDHCTWKYMDWILYLLSESKVCVVIVSCYHQDFQQIMALQVY